LGLKRRIIMPPRRIISGEHRAEIKEVADLREKKHADLTAGDIKRLVIIIAKKAGLLK
jgi:hypothetical protein